MPEDIECKTISDGESDNWGDAREVAPIIPDPERCAACGIIFIPTHPKARRCDWCRLRKIPYLDSDNADKPF